MLSIARFRVAQPREEVWCLLESMASGASEFWSVVIRHFLILSCYNQPSEPVSLPEQPSIKWHKCWRDVKYQTNKSICKIWIRKKLNVRCSLLGLSHFIQFDCALPWKTILRGDVKITEYINVVVLLLLYFILSYEIRTWRVTVKKFSDFNYPCIEACFFIRNDVNDLCLLE